MKCIMRVLKHNKGFIWFEIVVYSNVGFADEGWLILFHLSSVSDLTLLSLDREASSRIVSKSLSSLSAPLFIYMHNYILIYQALFPSPSYCVTECEVRDVKDRW